MSGFHGKVLKTENPERYSNVGKKWSEEDIVDLLACVQKKMSHSDIAEKHKRTDTSILLELKKIAADYYFNDERPLADIMKYTGLSAEQVSDAISKRQYRNDMAEKKKEKAPIRTTPVKMNILDSEDLPRKGTRDEFYTVISELLEVAKDIQRMMKDFHSDTFVSKS